MDYTRVCRGREGEGIFPPDMKGFRKVIKEVLLGKKAINTFRRIGECVWYSPRGLCFASRDV